MAMDNVTLENTQRSISNRDAKSVASVMVNGKWVNLSDTLEQANVKSDVGTVSKQVVEQQKIVISAVAQADSAVAYANEAIKKSRVNSQAIVEINSAVSDAVSDAAVARSDGLRAWNAAQSNVGLIDSNYASASAAISSARTEAIAAADEAKAAASAAQADVVAVRSDVAAVRAGVATTRSDVAVAKSDIADTKTSLASQAKSLSSYAAQASAEYASTASALSDAKTELSSDVAEAKNLANTAQTTADNAIKSASSVADDLTKVASQAKANADGITKVTSDVGLLQTTVANNTGDISTIQETAKQIQQAVSDNAGNITVAKQTADSAVAVASDARSNATVAVQTASQASITASNASGQAASAVITANGAMTTANNAQSNATVAVQTASGASLTAINANSDATVAKQTASEAKVQASNAESDFAQLSIRAGHIEASVANNSGAIANVQQTANGLTTTVADIKANGGGVNLLTGTRDFAGISTQGSKVAVTNGQDKFQAVTGTQSSSATYYDIASFRNLPLEKDTDYTASFWVKTSENTNIVSYLFDSGSNGNYADGATYNQSTTDYTRVVVHFHNGTNTATPNFLPVRIKKTGVTVWLYGCMLEKGTVAHDYSPAPADLQNQFTQTKESIDGITTIINDPKTGLNATYQTATGNATTISNIKGDVSQLKVSASSASVALSDAAGNISSLQATASDLETKYADAAGDISQLQADAKGMTQTISNAQGDIAKLQTRADGFDAEFATANGNISKLQSDASGTKQTLTNAKSDIAVLQSRADGFDTKYADAAGDINTLKVDASGMKQTLIDTKGDISTLQATATGFKNTLTDAQGNISTLQSDVAGLKKTTSDHAGNIATLQSDAKTLTSQMSSAQGDISTLKQTASGMSSKVSGMETSLADANSKLNNLVTSGRNYIQNSKSITMTPNGRDNYDLVWYVYNDAFASNAYCHGNNKTRFSFYLKPSKALSTARTFPIYWRARPCVSFGTITVPANTTDTQYYELAITTPTNQPIASQIFIRFMADSTSDVSYTITKSMLTIGDSFPDWQPAPEDTDAKITTNSTAIEQNKKAIALKADQTTVDKTNETVQQLRAQLNIQADQISAKVSSSDLNAKGYATQTYTQTQIKQASDSWNANLASVKNGLTDKYTNLHATVDGIQAQVYNKDGSSKITHLSDLIAAKVSSSDLSNLVGKGGRNLVANTNTDIVIDATSDNASDYLFVRLGFTEQPKQGDLITISAESALTGTLDEYQVILYDSYTAKPRSQAQYLKAGERDSVTLSLDNLDGHGDTFLLIYAGKAGETKGKKNVVHHLMVEKGAIAHGWQPAPEDMQTYTQAQVTLLKDAINLRVAKGNVVSQINQEAGGNMLIQVANGQGKLALNAGTVDFSGIAFIPDAYITTLNADKLRFYDDSGNVATMSAGLKQYDDDKAKKTIVLQYAGGYEVHASDLLGSILTMHDNTIRLAVKAHGDSDMGSKDQYSGFYAMSHYAQLSCYRSDGRAPGIYITDDGYTIKGDYSGNGTKYGDLNITSPQIYVTGGNSVSLSGTNAVQMQVNKTHAWLSDGMLHLYKDGDSSSTATQLKVDGWAWINGWVEAAGHSQHSALSTKTDIQSVDDDKMLEMVNNTDLVTFLYTMDVANGETHRHIGLIIDDVHDVAQYQTPQEFIAPNGVSRDDDNMIGALFGAVKALTKKFKTLESKVG